VSGTASFSPDNLEFVILCFEGPDQPYSMAGGLGVRVAELSQALAAQGYTTHLIFIGDPDLPGYETREDGRLILYRWCQWISRYYPAGVYDGEEGKLADFNDSVPPFVLDNIVRPAASRGKVVAVLAEEWHTAEATCRLSDLLHWFGLRQRALLLWNANNHFSFHRINWGRLGYVATITTVSKYMKHIMWDLGLNPLVIPNGVPDRFLLPADPAAVAALQAGVGGAPLLFKIGRFDPDKRWMMAVEAAARMRERGFPVKLLIRGGIEPHGGDVLGYAHQRGLRVCDVTAPNADDAATLAAISAAAPMADLLNLKLFISDDLKRACYVAADAVLANSGHEPFGIVGLEVMGAGGVAVVGATGEDYALPFHNCLVTETDDPEELIGYLLHLRSHPALVEEIRRESRRTARLFTWPEVIENLLGKLEYLAMTRRVTATATAPTYGPPPGAPAAPATPGAPAAPAALSAPERPRGVRGARTNRGPTLPSASPSSPPSPPSPALAPAEGQPDRG
jgi:glycosyltransferase involved in cell wall biosynthesis